MLHLPQGVGEFGVCEYVNILSGFITDRKCFNYINTLIFSTVIMFQGFSGLGHLSYNLIFSCSSATHKGTRSL
jgi:hypothetical protein